MIYYPFLFLFLKCNIKEQILRKLNLKCDMFFFICTPKYPFIREFYNILYIFSGSSFWNILNFCCDYNEDLILWVCILRICKMQRSKPSSLSSNRIKNDIVCVFSHIDCCQGVVAVILCMSLLCLSLSFRHQSPPGLHRRPLGSSTNKLLAWISF